MVLLKPRRSENFLDYRPGREPSCPWRLAAVLCGHLWALAFPRLGAGGREQFTGRLLFGLAGLVTAGVEPFVVLPPMRGVHSQMHPAYRRRSVEETPMVSGFQTLTFADPSEVGAADTEYYQKEIRGRGPIGNLMLLSS